MDTGGREGRGGEEIEVDMGGRGGRERSGARRGHRGAEGERGKGEGIATVGIAYD